MTPPHPLRYAVDVTPDDVVAITGFIKDRLIHRKSWGIDTEEYRTNAALRNLVPAFTGTLGHYFSDKVVQEAEADPVKRLQRVQEMCSTWNLLAETAYQ
ncbi:hypothetical protein AB0N88_33005 [Streptomyces sp. NPDC093516]|uniref:hypothetical protein n=1 Tax=Streptomyces sp. NPDC093516 TaxID=3155304 RepID=UPI003429AA3B